MDSQCITSNTLRLPLILPLSYSQSFISCCLFTMFIYMYILFIFDVFSETRMAGAMLMERASNNMPGGIGQKMDPVEYLAK